MEQTGGDGGNIHLQLGQDVGDFHRVDEIGFAGKTHLSLMDLGTEDIGLADDVQVCLGVVREDLFENIV